MKLVLRFAFLLSTLAIPALAQTPPPNGPGGVGFADGASSLQGWWRADKGVTSAAGFVTFWADNSGFNHTLSQGTGGSQPSVTTNATLNGQSVIRYSGAQFFNSSFLGPNTPSLTMFLVANGTSYQSLLRFQDDGSNFVVYPWNFGPPVPNNLFISSTEGGTGGGIASGLVASVNNIGGARITANTTNGMQTWLNGGLLNQKTSVGTTLPTEQFYSGKYSGGGEFPNCDVGEMIVYYSALNDAQMIIVQNYLSAKFNSALIPGSDVYKMDDPANGDYDNNVAGIGRVNGTNFHSDAQGTGFVRMLNATDLGDGEYFMWGHDNGAAQATNTVDIPPGVTARFARVWRISEVGEVGNLDMLFNVTGLSDFSSLSTCDASASIRLLVDTDNDGTFIDQTPISGATNIGGNVYRFANVTPVNNGNRFTIAIVASGVTGPGGVGGTNGTTNLKLWMDAGKGVTATGTTVTSWADISGNGINCTPPTGANPTIVTGALNTVQSVINFNGSQYLQLSANVNMTAQTSFIVANKTIPGTGYMTILTLQNNLWLMQGSGTDQWGMYLNGDVLSGFQVTSTPYKIMTALERNFNDVDFYTNENFVNRTTGTALHGKALGTIGANNNGIPASGLQIFNGRIAEIAVYNSVLNSAQRIIVDNYLAAKYGLTLSANDIYTQDAGAAPDNFDFDVAGIGRFDASNIHSDARGTGIVRISNPSSLDNGDYLLWGHNNLPLQPTTTDLPAGVQAKLQRIWAVNEVGSDVGSLDIQFDMTGFSPVTTSDLRLLIDDGNGIFNEGSTTVIAGATALSCNNYLFSGVPGAALGNGMRFTLGTANKIQTPLPVELLSFYATIGNDGVNLHWTTATEHNSDYFAVERSLNGEKFSEVLRETAAGTSNAQKDYALVDFAAPAGKVYYRLRMVDYNGEYTYSKIVAVDNPFVKSQIMVSPNPVRIGSDLEVRFVGSEFTGADDLTFSLYDVMGRSIPVTFERQSDNYIRIKTGSIQSTGFFILKIGAAGWTREYVQRVYIFE